RAAAPIVASYPYYCSRPGHPVPAIGTFFPGCLECRGTVPAQATGVLPGTRNSTSQAHRRCALFVGVVVPILQLERGIDDCQTRHPRRLASPGIQAVVAVHVAVGTTSDFGRSSPGDCAHGGGESDLGRGADSGGAVGEARHPGIAPDGAGVLAAKCGSQGQEENPLSALETLRAES